MPAMEFALQMVSMPTLLESRLELPGTQFMGQEFKKKGVQVALGPVVGPIGRIATGGMLTVAVKLGDNP
jgi:hypothetical protein